MERRRATWLGSLIGSVQPVVVEKDGHGHAPNFARLRVPKDKQSRIGSIVPLRVNDLYRHHAVSRATAVRGVTDRAVRVSCVAAWIGLFHIPLVRRALSLASRMSYVLLAIAVPLRFPCWA